MAELRRLGAADLAEHVEVDVGAALLVQGHYPKVTRSSNGSPSGIAGRAHLRC
jgi:hypothetical protein